jgi:hypothetical protein
MSSFLIIHQITLPEEQDSNTFIEFMRDEYLPAVHKGPTRVGQVIGLALLRGVTATHERTNTFHMHINFGGLATGKLRIENEEVQRKFETFGARVEHLGTYGEVAAWSDENGS